MREYTSSIACNFSIKEENKEGRFVLIFAKLLDLVKAVDNVSKTFISAENLPADEQRQKSRDVDAGVGRA